MIPFAKGPPRYIKATCLLFKFLILKVNQFIIEPRKKQTWNPINPVEINRATTLLVPKIIKIIPKIKQPKAAPKIITVGEIIVDKGIAAILPMRRQIKYTEFNHPACCAESCNGPQSP